MDAKAYNDTLIQILEQHESSGADQVSTSSLHDYLRSNTPDLSGEPSVPFDARLEQYKAELQRWNDDHRRDRDQSLEFVRFAVSAGQNAMRSSLLMNGGASVALLAFIGHLAAVDPGRVSQFATSLTWFVSAVHMIGVASGFTYAAQWLFADWENRTWSRNLGGGFNLIAIILGVASYGLFAKGMIDSYSVLSNYL